MRAGFEGGQTPLYRRLPKFVGRPMGPGHTKKEFHLITLEALNAAEDGATVSFETLFERGERVEELAGHISWRLARYIMAFLRT